MAKDKTPLQVAEEAKLEAQQGAVAKINKIMNESGLQMAIKQTIEIIPKK